MRCDSFWARCREKVFSCGITLASRAEERSDRYHAGLLVSAVTLLPLGEFEPSWVRFSPFVWVFCSNRPQVRQNGDSRPPVGTHARCVDGCLLRSYWTGCLPGVLPSHYSRRCAQVCQKKDKIRNSIQTRHVLCI